MTTFERADDKVNCENGGKHHPRTVDFLNDDKIHQKFSLCRKCGKIV